MAKQTYTINHDIRIAGKVVKAGTKYTLDPEDKEDAALIGTLRASGRLEEPLTAENTPSASQLAQDKKDAAQDKKDAAQEKKDAK